MYGCYDPGADTLRWLVAELFLEISVVAGQRASYLTGRLQGPSSASTPSRCFLSRLTCLSIQMPWHLFKSSRQNFTLTARYGVRTQPKGMPKKVFPCMVFFITWRVHLRAAHTYASSFFDQY